MKFSCYVDLLLPLPIPGIFTYAVNEEQAAVVKRGVRANVQLG
jgi:primosomal protein N'